MKKSLKRFIKISVIVLLSVFFILCLKAILSIGGNPPLSEYDMDKVYYSNKAILNDVADYLKEQDYDFIALYDDKKSDKVYVSNENEVTKYIKISDESVALKIDYLFVNIKYESIAKKGNGIYFQRWSGLKYRGGVVYTMDGERPQNKRLINLQPLPEKNWYFYEER